MGFVTLRGGRLWDGGDPLRFIGTNCYFLQEEGARERMGWEGYAGRVDEALRKAAALGLSVVRAWAFNDDPENPAAIQVAPLTYNEAGLEGVDLALATAAERGLRLILSLANYWPDYGGVAQYLRWHGHAPEETWRFFSDDALIEHYGDHVEALLSRINPLTGVAWGEDPTVLAWELMNEPRGEGLDPEGDQMLRWVGEITARARRAAPRQLFATGEEGLSLKGSDFRRNTALVDLASIHLYPEAWGWPTDQFEEAGLRWIEERAEIAAQLGRPLLIGELGLRNDGLPLEERRRIYDRWVSAALGSPSVAGVCTWSFSTDDRPDGWDDFTWRWRDGTAEGASENRYADLHRRWALCLTRGAS